MTKPALSQSPQFICSWAERIEEVSKYGKLLGALTGVKYQIQDKKVVEAIEKILKECERK